MNTAVLIATFVWPLNVAEPELPAVVVLQTQSGALDRQQLSVLTQVLTYELSTHDRHRVVTFQDINSQLGVEETKDMMGCDEVRCAAEIGMALKARYLLTSFAEPLGGNLFYSLNLIDTKTNETLRSQAKVPDAEAHYETAVRVALNELLNPELRRIRPLSDQELAISYAEDGGRPDGPTEQQTTRLKGVPLDRNRQPPPPEKRNSGSPYPAQPARTPDELRQSLEALVPACSAIDLNVSRARALTMLEVLRRGKVPADDWPGAMATLGKHYLEIATCSSSPNERRRSRMQAVDIFDTVVEKRPNYRERPLIERYRSLLRKPPQH